MSFYISPETRAKYAPQPGLLNISMDFNAAPSGTARGTEVVIPDNAPPAVRAAAERFNQRVAEFAARNGINDYPVRGVRTRSENGRGVPHTIHAEPFFNSDLDMQRAIKANPAEFAAIYKDAFGGIENARLIAPHGVGKDRGAASDIFGNETSFGQFIANAALGNDYQLPDFSPQAAQTGGQQMAQNGGLLGNMTLSTQGQVPQEPQEPTPWLQRDRTKNLFDTLAMGLEGMTMNPNQALIGTSRARMAQRGKSKADKAQRNKTADWLEQNGMGPLAEGVRNGSISAQQAFMIAKQQQGQGPVKGVEIDGRLVNPYTGEVMGDYTDGSDGLTTAMQTLQQRALMAGLEPGTDAYRQFMLEGGRAKGMALTVGSDGSVRLTQGDVDAPEDVTAVASPDAMLNSIDGILNDDALDFSTGFLEWTQNIPGTASRRFGARVQQLNGQAFLRAFDMLKGGGHITEIEGQKATEAIGRLDTAQRPSDYRDALNELKGLLELGIERQRSGGRIQSDRPSRSSIDINGTTYTIEEPQ